jgi:hypothetical protein
MVIEAANPTLCSEHFTIMKVRVHFPRSTVFVCSDRKRVSFSAKVQILVVSLLVSLFVCWFHVVFLSHLFGWISSNLFSPALAQQKM